MIDCNQEDKCRVCGGDGSACETTSNVIKDQDMTMGYNDLAMIPPGATNIRIAEVQFLSPNQMNWHHSLVNLGEGFQQLLGPEEPDWSLLSQRQLAHRLPTTV